VRITFGIDFDDGYWPGPLGERQATAGEVWVGPSGLLGLLETALGLGRPQQSALLRAATLIKRVGDTEGFWSRTAEVDPLGAARTLLEWRDELRLAGWRGEAPTPWLRQLAAVTEAAPPGFADRVVDVTEALERRSVGFEEIVLGEDPGELARSWRRVLSLLKDRGCRISVQNPEAQTAAGDLGELQSGRVPGGTPDGTFQLLRPYGPLAAADGVAAWLAQQPDLDGTVIIGGDPILDGALERFGLPTLGRDPRPAASPALQVLSLVIRLGFELPSAQAALDLLNLPVGPVPTGISFRLVQAISEWPSVESEVWRNKLTEGLETIEDESRREEVASRLEAIFTPSVPRGAPYPLAELERRVAVVRTWAEEQIGLGRQPSVPWRSVREQCGLLSALVESTGLEALSVAQLSHFVAEATSASEPGSPHVGQAGLASVGQPGCVAGSARRLVWWDFDTRGAAAVPRWPLPRETRAALAQIRVTLPDPAQVAEARADRWRRPLLLATEALLLVSPQKTDDGQERHPHPLWDELVGSTRSSLSSVIRDFPICPVEPPTEGVPRLQAPYPKRSWNAPPELLPPREADSPSSLRSMLGCSLQWALKYHGKLYPGREVTTQRLLMLEGNLLHEVIERTLKDAPTTPDQAAAKAVELFDQLGPQLAAPLFQPGMTTECTSMRAVASKAAHRLQEILNESDLEYRASEVSHEMKAFGHTLGGRLDLELGDPPTVLDLKLGAAKWRRKALASGTYHDLALYSQLIREADSAAQPSVGYFILTDQVLLTTQGSTFGAGEEIAGPTIDEVWAALGSSMLRRREEMDAGRLEAPENVGENGEAGPDDAGIVEGYLVHDPPCRFCDYAPLCGLLFTGESR
jgi:hypothetical protein